MKISSLRGIARLLGAFGFTGLGRVSQLLGLILWQCMPGRRRETIQRIQKHLEVPEEEARRIARASFSNNAMSFLEIFLLPKFDGLNDPRLRPSEGKKRWEELLELDRPVVFALAHLGSWELLATLLGNRSLFTIMRQHKDPAMNQLIHELRGVKGAILLDHRNASASSLALLRQNAIGTFLVDHNCSVSEAVFLPFLGQVAAVNKGPALLAVRTKAVVCAGFMERHKDATYTIHVYEKSLDTALLEGTIADKIQVTAEFYNQAVEQLVREKPEQWFWMHRRWKTRPKGEAKA